MSIGSHKAELNFDTVREIGHHGRNSKVYIARDKQLDADIVIKKIAKSDLTHATEYFREAKILYASHHPFVVTVNYACEDDDYIYIAMPYYPNGSLKQKIGTRFLTVREVLRYSLQFLTGLHNIHTKKLLHLDIKPDNILLSNTNEALLSDFGLSKAMDHLGIANQELVYEKHVPPEAIRSNDRTLHFDIYLAGLTIYRLLNGDDFFYSQITFADEDEYIHAVLNGEFPNRSAYLPHIPLKLQRTVNKALSIDINDRHQNVLELINELSDVSDHIDWQYSKSGSIESWSTEDDERSYKILLDSSDLTNLKVESTKTMKRTSNTTKSLGHCYTGLTPRNVMSKVKKALKELS